MTGARDDILWHVIEPYKSYINRNSTKKKKQFPKRGVFLKQGKAMNFKDGKIKVNVADNTFSFKSFLQKQEITLPYKESYYDNLHLVGEEYKGGNIVFNSLYKAADNELGLLVYDGKEYYFPEHVVGMDVNKNTENWITFSEPMENGKITLPKPENVIEIEKRREEFNKKLSFSKKSTEGYVLNSLQKRKMHRRRDKNFVHRLAAIEEAVAPVFKYFKEKYNGTLGIAIDGVATGAKGGNSFGQEDIRNVFVKLCVKNEVPFVIVPPQYTSQKCIECGELTKQDRKTSNVYLCSACGYFNENCDAIGALNIKEHGEFLFDEFEFTSTSLSTPHNKTTLGILFGSALKKHINIPQS